MANTEDTAVAKPKTPRRSTKIEQEGDTWSYEVTDPKVGGVAKAGGFEDEAAAKAAAKEVKFAS